MVVFNAHDQFLIARSSMCTLFHVEDPLNPENPASVLVEPIDELVGDKVLRQSQANVSSAEFEQSREFGEHAAHRRHRRLFRVGE